MSEFQYQQTRCHPLASGTLHKREQLVTENPLSLSRSLNNIKPLALLHKQDLPLPTPFPRKIKPTRISSSHFHPSQISNSENIYPSPPLSRPILHTVLLV
jgi:hypothetical protein